MEINKYCLGKIYTIRHIDTDKFYIGSTCQKYLSSRLAQHKSDYINNHKCSSCKILFDIGIDDCYIELLENYTCNNKEELNKREGELIRLHKDNVVNKCIAGRTKKECDKQYRETNKEKIKKSSKEYREKNEVSKHYREKNKDKLMEKYNCECGGKYTTEHKLRHMKSLKHINYII